MIDPKHDKDFLDFLNSKDVKPSEQISSEVLNFVKADLDPSHKVVFSKLLGIQTFIGILTLTFCPQFNLSLTNSSDFFHYFHHTFGENICMAICGSIFMGSGAFFAAYILKLNEIQKIMQSRLLYFTSVSILALSTFLFLGAEVYLTLAVYWLLGSTIGGLIIFELNRLIRRGLIHDFKL